MAALAFAKKGLRVLVLEKGENYYPDLDSGGPGTQFQNESVFGNDELKLVHRYQIEPDPLAEPRTMRHSIADGDRLRVGDFANFARTYSQDGSASQGGDLGWISPGETVPEFERAMNNLKDGEVSDPVRSEYGYHLIQVLGRREAEGSVQQQLDTARQAIGQRKAEQAYSDWLRELRDTAYVQYKGVAAQQALNQ